MALTKDIKIDEREYAGAYISFEHLIFEGKEASDNRLVRGVLYARKRKGDDEIVAFYDCNFTYDLSSQDNLWKQAYVAAKALPELADAVDVP